MSVVCGRGVVVVLNEVLSITAQESQFHMPVHEPAHLLNEVLSITAQEYSVSHLLSNVVFSSMKS